MRFFKTRKFAVMALLALLASLVTFGATADASTPSTVSTSKPYVGLVYGCWVPHLTLTFHGPYTSGKKCGAGHQIEVWYVGPTIPTGAKGATGPAGPTGPQGIQGIPGTPGTNGTNGTDGAPAFTEITATTNVSNWPEGSGWATDAFTRQIAITHMTVASSAHCDGAATCYLYTGTLTDNGTFSTNDNAKAPNGDGKDINGTVQGTINGVATWQLYASSDSPDASLVPVTADGASKPSSTTAWAELAFPAGTKFGTVKLTYYDWKYAAPNSCENWNDGINPGDDGQSEADGNIVGVNACS